jgi:hypothetical protein
MIQRTGIFIALLLFIAAPGAPQTQQPQGPMIRTPFGDIQRPGVVTTSTSDIQKIITPTTASDDSAPLIFYRLEFTIREFDGEKLVDTRNYTLSVQSGVAESLQAGSEVPYPSGSYSTAAGGSTKNISYRTIGVSIGCTVKEADDNPRLDLKLEVSDSLPPAKDSDAPIFRKIVLNCRSLLPLGKSTIVGTAEDPGSRHRFQVDVIATKLK